MEHLSIILESDKERIKCYGAFQGKRILDEGRFLFVGDSGEFRVDDTVRKSPSEPPGAAGNHHPQVGPPGPAISAAGGSLGTPEDSSFSESEPHGQ